MRKNQNGHPVLNRWLWRSDSCIPSLWPLLFALEADLVCKANEGENKLETRETCWAVSANVSAGPTNGLLSNWAFLT